ncbi:uncharacterized protein HMPREF1541_10261 [Cyphellophora europaea CBS 101466]|uniref:Calcineurin-like phosphoesterase domain-containing protein n=1 Tax=Cyphellophora europaea (strain CBS 101466) TaxID=1220924 RepID=W2S7A5_CYPE1|nr:uncharacterized protein HMPREF1541_10261 [Cyphellophora europaea CBS 101466]ETN44591.1 hypothetical protein HMPREF1541_10261 [Cyphellophora europaea CBS 101466]
MVSEKPRQQDEGPFTVASSGVHSRKTLVEYCTNEWQTPSANGADSELWYDKYLDRLDEYYDACLAVAKAPKFRRLVLSALTAALFTWLLWTRVLWPWLEEERAAWDTFHTFSESTSQPLFGTNSRPHLGGLIQTKDLDSSLLPGAPNADKSRRLIFIGDIHGCKKELLELLHKVKFNEATDHIISVGDIVTKGPDSLGVIDILRERKASVVRGNHDDRVILLAERKRRHARGEGVEDADSVGIETRGKGKLKHKSADAVAGALSDEQLQYLKSFPLILKVGSIKGIGEMVAVHGGLVPGIPLESQDPVSVMNMRSIDLKTHVPSKLHHDKHKGSKPWFKIWGKYQRLLPAMEKWSAPKTGKPGKGTGQLTIIYGHDARMGLQISRFSKGLDTNCARAGQLTALVVHETGKEELVQQQCYKDYTSLGDEE